MELINLHQQAIDVLNNIQTYRKMQNDYMESANGYAGQDIPGVKEHFTAEAEKLKPNIEKLGKLYLKILNLINQYEIHR